MFLRTSLLMLALTVLFAVPVAADATRIDETRGLGYDAPFWPGGSYQRSVRSPSDFLGFELGARPAQHAEVEAYFKYLDSNFSNVFLVQYGTTYEGRALYYLTVTSQENAQQLAEITAKLAKIGDPRKLSSDDEATQIIAATPASSWMAYGIHGDELSSSDAAVQLAYQLVAGQDDTSTKIRDEVITLIDPMENPDGRTRWLKQIESNAGVVTVDDIQSMNHAGLWPWGRTNHYLFDLNRDWFALVHPESRGRAQAILKWNPVFLLDCHEMGPLNTYLFSPPRPPFNPYMVSYIHKWWGAFAEDQGAAFDEYGWSYYTREWNEEFYPGYGSSWGIYIGAIGMLYEQAGVDGARVKRAEGTVMTYRETVHHQFISSMANLATVANNREALLQDLYAEKKNALGGGRRAKSPAWVLPPSDNSGRMDRFIETLQLQNIEVERVTKEFSLRDAVGRDGRGAGTVKVPVGAAMVRSNQPLKALVDVILTFDIPIDTKFLEVEKKERMKSGRTEMYETTAWSLPLAYNLECYFTKSLPTVESEAYVLEAPVGRIVDGSPKFGYAIDIADDRAYVLLGRLYDNGYKVWSAVEPFQVGERHFRRGSLLIRLNGNPGLRESDLEALAKETGVKMYGVNTSLGAPMADLGGNEFTLLERPRVAVIGGPNISSYFFGATWHLLDARLGYKTTTLNFSQLGQFDLRKYNVLVLPQGVGPSRMKELLGESGIKKLKGWIADGGTLIAMGTAAAFLADEDVKLSQVRQRRQVLKEVSKYDSWTEWLASAESVDVDSTDVWGKGEKGDDAASDADEDEDSPPDPKLEEIERSDWVGRRLHPRGAIVSVDLDDSHWLTYGEDGPMPAMLFTSYAYVSKSGVQVPGRLGDQSDVRMSGLMWPEARERWASTDYVTRESSGNGQIIMFAYPPNFRGFFHGGERLLTNAIFFGPGFGTQTSVEW